MAALARAVEPDEFAIAQVAILFAIPVSFNEIVVAYGALSAIRLL